jgi:mono/diheme cytochrome c family protein
MRVRGTIIGVGAAALLLAGCGGGGEGRPARAAAQGEAGDAPGAAAVKGPLPQGVTREEVALGRELYAGACIMCHGASGGGTQLGPPLSGTPDQVQQVVRSGVPEPDGFPVPMPANGSGTFDAEETRAVAAYVSALAAR